MHALTPSADVADSREPPRLRIESLKPFDETTLRLVNTVTDWYSMITKGSASQ
jgi:hypothetical protein